MVIVPVGKVNLQVEQRAEGETYFSRLFCELSRNCNGLVSRCVEEILEDEVDQLLKRKRHQRRCWRDEKRDVRMKCSRCGSQKVSDFRRNGHYRRGLETSWGHIQIQMPQVECQCGGGVRVAYKTLRVRQRIWKDLEVEFRSGYGYGMSLRRIKAKYDEVIGGSLGLRTINSRVHAVAESLPLWQQTRIVDPPPVVRMDGIWMNLMKSTGIKKQDKLGRMRTVKTGKRVPILVAQGVWPASGRQEVIGWVIADGENQAGWSDLVYHLRQRGVRVEDLRLLIADGSSGLEALRQKNFPQVPFQRCIFHKLKNLWAKLIDPDHLDHLQIRAYKLKIIRHAAQIWQAKDEGEAWRCLKAFSLKWQTSQPQAVAFLNEGFEWTVSFYQVVSQAAQNGEHWQASLLRTTSHLERENRSVRRRLDGAVVFHSIQGLSACLYLNQVLCQSMRSSFSPGTWIQTIELQIAEAICFLN
jgi:putative transposase